MGHPIHCDFAFGPCGGFLDIKNESSVRKF